MTNDRLRQQLQFIVEMGRLKGIIRRTWLIHEDRLENSAEHSWQAALLALIAAEHANEKVDPLKILKMLLIHDIVEIDAGDTFCYDVAANAGKAEREERAAERLFGLLPVEQGADFREIWREFEERKTPEARFAAAVDRVLPLLHNYHTQGRGWKAHAITSGQVLGYNGVIADGSADLWEVMQNLIQDSVARGYLPEK